VTAGAPPRGRRTIAELRALARRRTSNVDDPLVTRRLFAAGRGRQVVLGAAIAHPFAVSGSVDGELARSGARR
jgi:hypothetical protein